MSIGLSFFNPIISFKIFNSENKSKPSRSNKSSRFKYFSRFKHFSFKSTQPNNFKFLILNKKPKISSHILNCSNLFWSVVISLSTIYKK